MTQKLRSHLDNIFSMDEKDIDILFSEERVKTFGGKESYKDHLLFIQEIYPSLQMIEVLLRNKIDLCFKRAITQSPHTSFSNEWLLDLYATNYKPLRLSSWVKLDIERLQNKIHSELLSMKKRLNFTYSKDSRKNWIAFLTSSKNRSYIHNLLVSKLNFGFWINIFSLHFYIQRENKIQLDLAKNIFPSLYALFSSRLGREEFLKFFDTACHHSIDYKLFSNQQNTLSKVIVFVSMIRVMRNRISHCEFLFKYNNTHSSIRLLFQGNDFYLKANKSNIIKYLDYLLRDLSLL